MQISYFTDLSPPKECIWKMSTKKPLELNLTADVNHFCFFLLKKYLLFEKTKGKVKTS